MSQPTITDPPGGSLHRIELPATLSTPACDALHRQLIEAAEADAPVEIDASAVETVGQAALQLLVAARREVVGRGGSFAIAAPSASFHEQVERCGIGPLIGLDNRGMIQ